MRRLLAVSLALATVAWGPTSASALTIGPDFQPDPSVTQSINYPSNSVLFNAAGPPGIRLFSPTAGVITRWRVALGDITAGSTVQLRVISPSGGSNFTLWRAGPVEPLAQRNAQADVHTFPANVPIAAGHGVGIHKTHPQDGWLEISQPQDVGDPSWMLGDFDAPPPDGVPSSATVYSSNGLFRMISADVEPDADGDLFGDDTQDLCDDQAGGDRGCPPGALEPKVVRETVVEVHTVTPAGALAQLDPASVAFTPRRRRLQMTIVCPSQQTSRCTGRASATTRANGGRRALKLGRRRFAVDQGSSEPLQLRVPRRTRRAIAKRSSVEVTVTLTASSRTTAPAGG